MADKQHFFDYINHKVCEPRLRESKIFEQTTEMIKDQLIKIDYFRAGYSETELMEAAMELFRKGGGLREVTKEKMSLELQEETSLDQISDFAKRVREEICMEWRIAMAGEDSLTTVIREAVEEILVHLNFFPEVAPLMYGKGVDEDIRFLLSCIPIFEAWPGELPSQKTMLQTFEIVQNTDVPAELEKMLMDVAKEAAVKLGYGEEPVLQLESLLQKMSDCLFVPFDGRIDELMQEVQDSEYQYKNFFYWLLSDIAYEALGIRQVTAYFAENALHGECIRKEQLDRRIPYETCMEENQKWFEEYQARK